MRLFGAIEAGGTKFVCAVGTGPEDLRTAQFPTTSPNATVNQAVSWLRKYGAGQLAAIGIGSFGPVDLCPDSPSYGYITSTPKAAWRNFDLRGVVERTLGVPTAFDTDVNAAVLAEARWGAAQGVDNCLYLTVGTGVGGGAMISGALLQGKTHPEMGHIRVPHDLALDPFRGNCPYHKDCLEGLASGPAIEARWGVPGTELPDGHPAWALEAGYLGCALANFVAVLSPELIVIGGGVMRRLFLYNMVRAELEKLAGGYFALPPVVPPALGDGAGVLGALILAELAVELFRHDPGI